MAVGTLLAIRQLGVSKASRSAIDANLDGGDSGGRKESETKHRKLEVNINYGERPIPQQSVTSLRITNIKDRLETMKIMGLTYGDKKMSDLVDELLLEQERQMLELTPVETPYGTSENINELFASPTPRT
jgi:hypothetical protein